MEGTGAAKKKKGMKQQTVLFLACASLMFISLVSSLIAAEGIFGRKFKVL
jgi:hypothetical protein